MFFLKKQKPALSELISEGYIDIHSHLLPGIDDGSKDMQNSIDLILALKKLGFEQFNTTPHIIQYVWNNTADIITEKLNLVKTELITKNINNYFHAAAEYMMDDGFAQLLKTDKLLTLKENYVLVEMSYLNPPMQLFDIIFDLQVAGYKPVLAHPERYSFYHSKTDQYDKLKKAGCLFQLNLLSTVGYYGDSVMKIADYLLEKNMIDFVGSDVHHSKHVEFFYSKIKIKNQDNLKTAIQNNLFFKK